MLPHDEIVAAMLAADSPATLEVRLLGRVNDALIGNPSAHEVFVFVPDLHLVSPARRVRFAAYGFNHEDSQLLAKVLRSFATLRRRWESTGEATLITIQLGDFFDLWREFPGAFDPAAIPDDAHGALRDVLYRGVVRGRPCLEATILLGNHDTKGGEALPNVSFFLKAFDPSPTPFLFATHGDAFDILERWVPDRVEEFIVYGAGAHTPVNAYPVAQWGRRAEATNRPPDQMRDFIVAARHDLTSVGGALAVRPEMALPDRLAQVVESAAAADHRYVQRFDAAIAGAAARDPSARRLRVVVIGHTHQAAMVLCRPPDGGRPLLFIDAGAWIEQCSYHLAEGRPVTEPSAQIAVIQGNDARLYQIRRPA